MVYVEDVVQNPDHVEKETGIVTTIKSVLEVWSVDITTVQRNLHLKATTIVV